MAFEETQWTRTRERYIDEIEAARERSRTKCLPLGKMTKLVGGESQNETPRNQIPVDRIYSGAMACKRCLHRGGSNDQQLSPARSRHPINPIPAMSKHDKLMRFAHLVRLSSRPCALYHRLEHASLKCWRRSGLATRHSPCRRRPILKDAGFTG